MDIGVTGFGPESAIDRRGNGECGYKMLLEG